MKRARSGEKGTYKKFIVEVLAEESDGGLSACGRLFAQ